MKKRFTVFFLSFATVILSTTGCYKKELADFQKQIDDFKKYNVETLDPRVKTLEEQVAAIEVTIEDLEGIREELDSKVAEVNKTIDALRKDVKDGDEALAADIAALEKLVEELKSQQSGVDTKISELKTYVNDEIKNTKDWVNGTFATLDQLKEVSKTVTELGAVVTEIQTLAAKHGKDIEALQASVAKLEKVEENLKAWVNKQLDNYYDIATIDSKLSILTSNLTDSYSNADKALKSELEKEISDSYDKITEEYKEFVKLAIEVGGGEIGEEIQKQLNAIKKEMTEKFEAMNERVGRMETSILQLGASIKSCEQQIANMSQSLAQLTNLYNEIDRTVAELKNTVDGFDSRIEALEKFKEDLGDTIKKLREELEEQIAESLKEAKSYTDELRTWTENTLKNYYTSTVIDEKLDGLKSLIDALDIRLDNLDGLEEKIKGWVSNNFYTKTQIDEKLAQIKRDYEAADASLKKEIEQLSSDLEKAKKDIEEAYTKAIEKAINELHGEITEEISTEINNLITEKITPLEDRVDAIEKRLDTIENRLKDLENAIRGKLTSIEAIPDYSNGMVNIPFEYGSVAGNFTKKTAEIKYQVYPSGMAKKIAALYAADKNTVQVKYKNTMSPAMQAVDGFNAVAGCVQDQADTNVLVLTINGSELSDAFYKTQFLFGSHQAVNMSMFILEKRTDKTGYEVMYSTNYVELYPYCPATLAFAPAAASMGNFEWRQGSHDAYAKDLKVTTKVSSANAAKYVGWKVAEKPSWVNIYPEQTLYDSESTVKVFLNSTMTAREGTIKFQSASGEELSYPVSQIARPAQTLTTDPAASSITFNSNGEVTEWVFVWNMYHEVIINVLPSDNVTDWTWKVDYEGTQKDWLLVLRTDDLDKGYSTVKVNATKNSTSSSRKAKLKFIPATGESKNCPTFSITQN